MTVVSMIVVAMFVVDMIAVRGMIVCIMIVARMPAARIGTAFWIERRFDGDHFCTETLHHLLDDMIAADTKSLADDLRRQMPVAEMPGDTHQMVWIGAAYLDQRFGRCDHLDQSSVFQHQRVAAAQRKGFLQIEQKFETSRPRHRHAAAMPVIVTKHDRIGGGLGPLVLCKNLCSADQRISTFSGVMISILVGALMHSFTTARHGFM